MTELATTQIAREPDRFTAEQELRRRLAGRRMVFELGLDEDEFRRWRRPLFIALRRYRPHELQRRFPALLVTYMAYAGTFHYEGGDYWSRLHPRLRDPNTETGSHFLAAVRRLGLEPFDRIVAEERAHTWVSRILAQGGIPRSCLGPFAELVALEVDNGAADGAELLAAWRTRRASLTQLHVPTRRFLLYGGDEAADLLDRCVELLREQARTGRMPSSAESGLPGYVVDAFARLDRCHARREVARRDGLARPQLRLEPYDGIGPVVVLPPVASEQLGGVWRVHAGDRAHRQEPSSYAPEVVKVPPTAVAEVEFLTSDGTRRRWTYDLLASGAVMFFDPASQALIRVAGALAADEVWALAPREAAFTVRDGDGEHPAREIQELPPPTGAWAGFAIRHLDLRGVRALHVDDGRGKRLLPVIPPRARPSLEGPMLEGVVAEGDAVVFRAPPRLRVPGAGDGLAWTLRLSGPAGERSTVEAPDADGFIDLAALLPDERFGVYRLRARGPIGSDLTTRFAVVEGLTVDRPTEIVLPGGAPPRVSVQAPDVSGPDGGEPGAPQVVEPPDDAATLAAARLCGPRGRMLDLSIAVPKLLWTIVHDTKPALQAGTRLVRVDAEEFDDHLADTLLVSAGRPGVTLAVDLCDRGGERLQALPPVTTVGASGRWAFDLGPFADTVRAAAGARLSIHLSVGTRRVHVADIVAAAHVRALRVSCEGETVHAEFKQDRLVRNRVLRLWSDARPWEPPIRLPILDGETTVSGARDARLTPGRYLAEVVVDDPWTTTVRPSVFDPGVQSLMVGTRDEGIAWLASLDPADPLTLVTWVLGRYRGQTEFSIEALADYATEVAIAFRALLDDTPVGGASSASFAGLARVASARDLVLVAAVEAARELEGDEGWLDRLDLRLYEHVTPTFDMLDEQTMAAVWHACPGLAARLDLPWAASDEQARDRCRRYLGWIPGEALPDPGGAQVRQLELRAPEGQLRDLRFALGLQPTGLLDPSMRVLGTFDWLLAQHAADAREAATGPREWYGRHRPLLSIEDVALPPSVRPELEEHLRARMPPHGTEPWAGVAAVLLAAAAHHRWGVPKQRHAALLALEEALPWARRLIRSDHALLTALTIAAEDTP